MLQHLRSLIRLGGSTRGKALTRRSRQARPALEILEYRAVPSANLSSQHHQVLTNSVPGDQHIEKHLHMAQALQKQEASSGKSNVVVHPAATAHAPMARLILKHPDGHDGFINPFLRRSPH
jgi:hypothetical protein